MEARQRVHMGVDLAQLRHPLGRQDQAVGAEQVLVARVSPVLAGQLARDDSPDLVFLGRVLDVGNGVARTVGGSRPRRCAPRRAR